MMWGGSWCQAGNAILIWGAENTPWSSYFSWAPLPITTITWKKSSLSPGVWCFSQILSQSKQEIFPSFLLSLSQDCGSFWSCLKRKWNWHHFLVQTMNTKRDIKQQSVKFLLSVWSHYQETLRMLVVGCSCWIWVSFPGTCSVDQLSPNTKEEWRLWSDSCWCWCLQVSR